MSSTGQFRIARDIFYDWTAEDRPWCSLALWLYIIGRGQYQDTTVTFLGHQFTLSRGQLVTTASHLCDMSGWTPKRLRTFLAKCQKDGKLIVMGTPNGTVISVINYDKWQGQTKGQSKGQASEQSQTNDDGDAGQTKGQSKGQQSIEGVKYLRCSVSKKESLEDMSRKTSKVTKKSDGFLGNAYAVLSCLNDKAHHQYQQSPSSVIEILKRLKAGATVSDLELIIDYKVYEWASTPLAKNLNNETLFRDCHYANYLEAARAWDIKRQTGANSLMMEPVETTPMTDEERKKAKADLFAGFGDGPDGDDLIQLEAGK